MLTADSTSMRVFAVPGARVGGAPDRPGRHCVPKRVRQPTASSIRPSALAAWRDMPDLLHQAGGTRPAGSSDAPGPHSCRTSIGASSVGLPITAAPSAPRARISAQRAASIIASAPASCPTQARMWRKHLGPAQPAGDLGGLGVAGGHVDADAAGADDGALVVTQRRGGDGHHRQPPSWQRSQAPCGEASSVGRNGLKDCAGDRRRQPAGRRLADQRAARPAERGFRHDEDEAAVGVGFERQIGRQTKQVLPAMAAFDQGAANDVRCRRSGGGRSAGGRGWCRACMARSERLVRYQSHEWVNKRLPAKIGAAMQSRAMG